MPYLSASGSTITLIKPQFQKWERDSSAGRIVRDDGLRQGLRTRSLPVPRLWGWIWLVVWSRLSRGENQGNSCLVSPQGLTRAEWINAGSCLNGTREVSPPVRMKILAEVGRRCRLILNLRVRVLSARLMKENEETYESLGHRWSRVYRITRRRSIASRRARRVVIDNLVTGKRKNVPKAAQFYKLEIETQSSSGCSGMNDLPWFSTWPHR